MKNEETSDSGDGADGLRVSASERKALERLGWDEFFASAFAEYAREGLRPARVICELKHAYALNTGTEELLGECRGRVLHDASSRSALPGVGDWVAVRPRAGAPERMDILAVLPRRTKFSRRAAGEHGHEQVVAANADTLFIILALDRPPNLRKIERYLAVARKSGAEPVLLLNKVDVAEEVDKAVSEVKAVAGGAEILALSAEKGTGCRQLTRWLKPGRTVALLGPSGVGKSTLVNRIMRDEVQVVQEVRESDAKGRHTTTRRELFQAPSGALLIDTPGLRELQLWAADLADAFSDIEQIALRCRFSNCRHNTEPGCAIKAALESGELPRERWESYNKLRLEQAEMKKRMAARPDRRERIVWKKASSEVRPQFKVHRQHD